MMRTSKAGLDLIKRFEGLHLKAYTCPAGIWTIGYGHTGTVGGVRVKVGMAISASRAEKILRTDLKKFEKAVAKYKKYKWTQNEFDALVSFAFNVGNIDQLTAKGMRTKEMIATKFMAYNKAGTKTLVGLTRRRLAEKELFTKK